MSKPRIRLLQTGMLLERWEVRIGARAWTFCRRPCEPMRALLVRIRDTMPYLR